MRMLLSLCLVAVIQSAAADPSTGLCENGRTLAGRPDPLSIAEIERNEMRELPSELLIKSEFSKAPFGHGYPAWVNFKSRLRPGDQVIRYKPGQHASIGRQGEAGYASIRAGCVIETFVTLLVR